ncbi:MAG: hypothetical protein U0746_14380 [Gemmataceae bacterium]
MRSLSAVLSFAFAAAAFAGEPTPDEVDRAIRQLGDKRYAIREQASAQLWKYGLAAEAALRRAAKSDDAEVARRAKAILEKFDSGLYPDTSPAVRTQIDAFRAAAGQEDAFERRRAAVDELIKLGRPGYLALHKLGTKATDDAKPLLTYGLHRAASIAAAGLEPAEAEALLSTTVEAGDDTQLANYTAAVLFRGKIDDAITRWEGATANPSLAAEVLTYLYRARGDLAAARKHAETVERPELLDAVLWEQGDWKALARRPSLGMIRFDPFAKTGVGVKALYHQLAGEVDQATVELSELRTTTLPADDASLAKAVVGGLMLGEQVAIALDRAGKVPGARPLAFDILASQLRYREAFALADLADDPDIPTPRSLDIKKAIALHQLGESDRAGQELRRIAGSLQTPGDHREVTELSRSLMRLGLKGQARETVAEYLSRLMLLAVDPEQDPTWKLLESVFPQSGDAARTWWRYLHQAFPREEGPALMKRLTSLLDPGRSPPVLDSYRDGLLAAADGAAGRSLAHAAVAAAHEAAGRLDDAIRLTGEAARGSDDFLLWLKFGDLLAARQRYDEAAEAYAGAWQRDPSHTGASSTEYTEYTEDARHQDATFLAPFLRGWSLMKAGKAKEARAQIDLAHRLPLGDVAQRGQLAAELLKRDLPEFAKHERDLIRKLGWYPAWDSMLLPTCREAVVAKDFARAAECYDRIGLGLQANGRTFTDGGSYLSVPASARSYRARAALIAGKLDEAIALADAALVLSPGYQDAAILLVPELEKRGRTIDAQALFRKAIAPYETLAKEYPKSAFAHNGAAWVGACCHRELDAALAHAKSATELAPTNAGYLDTLAEVHFQRGETAKAIEHMARCIDLEPKRAYFRRQMKRFESGDRNTPPPDEDE